MAGKRLLCEPFLLANNRTPPVLQGFADLVNLAQISGGHSDNCAHCLG